MPFFFFFFPPLGDCILMMLMCLLLIREATRSIITNFLQFFTPTFILSLFLEIYWPSFKGVGRGPVVSSMLFICQDIHISSGEHQCGHIPANKFSKSKKKFNNKSKPRNKVNKMKTTTTTTIITDLKFSEYRSQASNSQCK